ncbi:hypothetical protein pqer_cds_1044 [Pandoravirus quercus]|uniref:Uncharacterized protein n=1 Tax=Pandoravirus quercus TaxID=2107709 RepID=A0A2U7UAL7_9VIRU|nr:hypothetical protein pqer_cds_1044 [Pandoravirus quercus]AVK75466.1 hypothetical protein pqer_cds_1044 [Pandoravirus quercus]
MDPAKTPRAPTREEQIEDLLRRLSLSCWTSPRDREDAIYALRTRTMSDAIMTSIREALARSDADRPCDLKRKKQD